jgi:hypothetical protein
VNRKLLALILIPTAVFMVALGGFLFWFLGGEEDAVKTSANQFAAAIVANNPSAAPEGGEAYVRGVRARFGPVQSAQLVSEYKKGDNGGSSTADDTSYWLAQIALRTERGPAVVEVRYDNNSLDPKNQEIRTVYEVKRDHSHGPDLASSQSPAAEPPAPIAETPVPAPAATPKVADDPAIRCLKKAKGDVEKLQRCAELR